jgi:hypothetical protein
VLGLHGSGSKGSKEVKIEVDEEAMAASGGYQLKLELQREQGRSQQGLTINSQAAKKKLSHI